MASRSRISPATIALSVAVAAAAVFTAGFAIVGAPVAAAATALPTADTLRIGGLQQPVEVLRDAWGIAHIYARNEHDLFFAQGYTAARDRAFQFEMWRRQATGTVAELLGPREVERDIGARLFRYRGSLDDDLARYHPRGAEIVGAFVDGINAYVDEAARDSTLVPEELRLLGIRPGRWTPDVVISRHQGLLGNIGAELANGRVVASYGADLLKKWEWFHPGPGEPVVDLDPAIDASGLHDPILALYEAFRAPLRFRPEDIAVGYRNDSLSARRLAAAAEEATASLQRNESRDIGSNNWVVSGSRTLSGRALMANDPHRAQSAPSLRYFVHLVAPGWNVIGGGEPVIPGVSIGHNEYGAWGLTIFSTDGEDLYVYQTNPADPTQYRYRGDWERMRAVVETITVKGAAPRVATMHYTRHGPVVYSDSVRHVAYAVRPAWLEPGGAPYLASLRMDQARNWEEFRLACSFSHIPGENMVWADVDGNIGWQSVGIAPVRRNWSGLVPVPGDGRYEWDGYLPIMEKPHAYNPASGFIATANSNLTPESYLHRDAIGWSWADPFRFARISEVLGSGRLFTMADMTALQTDYTSIPARSLVPLLAGLKSPDAATERARRMLIDWDRVLGSQSVPAGIYEAWYRQLAAGSAAIMAPADARAMLGAPSATRIIQWLTAPGGEFGAAPVAGRDSLLLTSLRAAVADLAERYGADMSGWQWGNYHQATIRHPMSPALNAEQRKRFEVGPWPRGGDSYTPGATGNGPNQTSGASFRLIVEAGDWDGALGTNTPGQSGDVSSPHYRDLFELWKVDRYFPIKYSRPAVEGVTRSRTMMTP